MLYNSSVSWLTISVELKASSDAHRHSEIQETPSISWNPNIHCHADEGPSLVPVLNQISPLRTFLSYSSKTHFTIIFYLRLSYFSLSDFLPKPTYTHFLSHMNQMLCLSHHCSSCHFDAVYKLWSCSLWDSLKALTLLHYRIWIVWRLHSQRFCFVLERSRVQWITLRQVVLIYFSQSSSVNTETCLKTSGDNFFKHSQLNSLSLTWTHITYATEKASLTKQETQDLLTPMTDSLPTHRSVPNQN